MNIAESPRETVHKLRLQNARLRKALKAAQEHLDYIGYGDAWERSTVSAKNTEYKIKRALKEKPL